MRAVAYPVPTERNAHPLMLKLVTRLLLPLAVLVTVHLFLRGHNLPGGGFIAGLVLAIAMVLLSIAHGEDWVNDRLRSDFRRWLAAGLLIAALTGAGSWMLGHPFLTSTYDYPVLPLVGAVPLASASLFDLGVFLAVVGGTMVMLTSIGRLRADPGNGIVLMELLVAIFVGVLTGSGVYLMLRARTFDLVLGLTLLSYAVNLLIFVMGRLTVGRPPILDAAQAPTLANYADPLPQALVLTAIVISFAMTALLLVIALVARAETGTDQVDGEEPRIREDAA